MLSTGVVLVQRTNSNQPRYHRMSGRTGYNVVWPLVYTCNSMLHASMTTLDYNFGLQLWITTLDYNFGKRGIHRTMKLQQSPTQWT